MKNQKTNKSSVNANQSKARRPKYKDDMKKSYTIGYARGWEDAYELPKRIGARKVAAIGYQRGARNRKKSDKYVSQYKKRG